jgi:predicted amidophosphoribosyltransferase
MELRKMILMTSSDELICPFCKRKMLLVKGTYLCPQCSIGIIWELNTPATYKEQDEWVNKNLGVNKNEQ